ncbi:MAG: O-methyltransferase [Anaerolineales bacterium]|nr:O-methyltransferase [Anaerolineales bacterium]
MPTFYDDAHAHYFTELFAPHDAVLQHIYDNIPKRGLPAITIRPEEGRFLQFLARACGARLAVEIGTLGGYSGVWIARGLLPGGRLITLEKEPHHAEVACEHFALAGLSDRVELRLGDAHELLPTLSAEGPFDFCFIDAEKSGYDAYLNWALANVRPGGVIAAHNAFRHGAIVDAKNEEPETLAMRAFIRRWATEHRLLSTLYPAGDGTLIGIVTFDAGF